MLLLRQYSLRSLVAGAALVDCCAPALAPKTPRLQEKSPRSGVGETVRADPPDFESGDVCHQSDVGLMSD